MCLFIILMGEMFSFFYENLNITEAFYPGAHHLWIFSIGMFVRRTE